MKKKHWEWLIFRKNELRFFLKIMKLSILFTLICTFSLSANVLSQQTLKLSKGATTYSELFGEIKKQTGYIVVYNNNRLDKDQQINIQEKESTLEAVLSEVLETEDVDYKLQDEYIILIPRSENSAAMAAASKRKVTGKVVDTEGLPLPGVTVMIKGSQHGVATDMEGNFTINLNDNQNALVISFIGMADQEVDVTGKDNVTVTLKPDTQQIEEIVVSTGYQKIDRRLFTGSAKKLKAEEVKLDGVADASRQLQGTVAGVEVENVSGTFGTAPIVRIRGNASINGTNRPLWVVDGVVLEDAVEMTNEELTSGNLTTLLSSSTAGINPEDIESFQVLKDASATALYGARAMNGVIVITTKKGAVSKPVINYSTSLTMKTKPSYDQFDIMSSGAEMSVYQELYEKGWIDIASSNISATHGVLQDMFNRIAKDKLNWGPNGSLNYDHLQRYANANTDWFDKLFKNSVTQQHSLSISQGSEKSRVRASIGFMNDPGQSIADNVKNYTGSIRADFNITDKFKIGFKLSGNIRDQKLAASENRKFNAIEGRYERNFDINPFNYALYTSRSITPYDENGNRQFFRRNYADFNIFHEIDHNKLELDLKDILFQTDLEYKFRDDLVLNATLQGRWNDSKAVQSVHENSNNAMAYRADDPLFREYNRFLFHDEQNPLDPPYSILPNGGFLKTTENSLTSYFVRSSLSYNPRFSDDHLLSFMLGQELRYNDRSYDYFEGWGYVFEKGGLILSDPNFIKYLDSRGEDYYKSTETRNRSMGAFINAAYSYQGKYIFNGTFRYDGDNRTGTSTKARYLPTWNISGAWNMHTEPWMENIDWINLLKVKSTYGLAGDNPVNASAALIMRGAEPLRPHISDRETALYIDALENSELTFEKLYEWNFGVEASFFNGKLYAELEYYNRRSKDLLGLIETNGVGGQSYKYGNVGEMKINGFEATITTENIKTRDFKWSTTLNYSTSKDEITKWYSRDNIGKATGRLGGNLVGYSRGALFSIPFAGLDGNGIPTFYGEDLERKIQKMNLQEREDIIKHLKYEGTTTPKAYGGLTNNFTYKNFNLSVGLVFRYGNKIRLDNAYSSTYSDHQALPGELINRWQFAGDEKVTNIPAIITRKMSQSLDDAGLNPYAMYNLSDARVADGSFVRLKNIRLGYALPKQILAKTFIKSADVSLSAYNLALLYSDKKLHGIDPEFYQSGGISMPLSRTYTFTLNFKF
jgi:TonB-linked SusC/RagA family outer membrane protein